MRKKPVYNMWIKLVEPMNMCGIKVNNSGIIHMTKISLSYYAHFLLSLCTAFMNNLFINFTDKNIGLYTSSTQPTKTIYLNKKEILI